MSHPIATIENEIAAFVCSSAIWTIEFTEPRAFGAGIAYRARNDGSSSLNRAIIKDKAWEIAFELWSYSLH
jgi:hypothetical protein